MSSLAILKLNALQRHVSKVNIDSLLFVGVLFIAFFLNLWGVPLFDLDEGAFSEATREMLATGNFAATYLDGVPRYDKPILSYWFQALSVSLFGLNEFALRLPSAIAASLWVAVTYRFVRQIWGADTAKYALLIMATTLWVCVIGRAAIADAWLNLFISLTFFDIWRYRQQQNSATLCRCYVWMALGLLTKGPVAVGIPFIATAIFFIANNQWRLWFAAIFNPTGWIILIALVAPWLYLVYQDQGVEFFKGFLFDHNIKRFQQEREGHGGSWFYFVIVLPLIILPYTGVLLKSLLKVKHWWPHPVNQFLLIWFAVVFCLVSLSSTKLPHYVVYGVTPLLILFAHYRKHVANRTWLAIFPSLFFALMLFLPWIVELAANNSKRTYEKMLLAQGSEVFGFDYYVVTALFTALFALIWCYKSFPVYQKLIATGVVQSLFVFLVLIKQFAALQQVPIQNAANFAKQFPNKTFVSYKIKMPSFSVYRQAITYRRKPNVGEIIFTRVDRLAQLEQEYDQYNVAILFQQGGIVLAQLNKRIET